MQLSLTIRRVLGQIFGIQAVGRVLVDVLTAVFIWNADFTCQSCQWALIQNIMITWDSHAIIRALWGGASHHISTSKIILLQTNIWSLIIRTLAKSFINGYQCFKYVISWGFRGGSWNPKILSVPTPVTFDHLRPVYLLVTYRHVYIFNTWGIPLCNRFFLLSQRHHSTEQDISPVRKASIVPVSRLEGIQKT